MWVEIVIDNLMWIALSMGLYYMYGLIGLGVSMMARSMINIGVAYGVTRSYYGFRYDIHSLTAPSCVSHAGRVWLSALADYRCRLRLAYTGRDAGLGRLLGSPAQTTPRLAAGII